MRALVSIWSLAVVLLCVAAPGRAASLSEEDGVGARLVESVEVRGLMSMGEAELLDLLGIVPGLPLRDDLLALGIRRAFSRGTFEYLAVDEKEGRPGVILVTVRERPFIYEIEIKGGGRVLRAYVREQLGLAVGDEYRPDAVEGVRDQVIGKLAEKGYPDARVGISFSPRKDRPHLGVLRVEIAEGEPILVRDVLVIGARPEEVRPRMKVGVGDILDRVALRADLDAIREYYVGVGYVLPAVAWDFVEGVLTVRVVLGTRLTIEVEGNEAMSDKDIRAALPFTGAREFREDMVSAAQSAILRSYRERGFVSAQVVALVEQGDAEVVLRLYVYEGERVRVRSVAIEGGTLPEDRVKSLLRTSDGGYIDLGALDADRVALREFYLALGYRDVVVDEPHVEIEGTDALVTFGVVEGERYVYSEIAIAGADTTAYESLAAAIALQPGDPFNEVDIADQRRTLLAECREMGYPDCAVNMSQEFSVSDVRIVFLVRQGEKRIFGKTIVSGTIRTDDAVVRRELLYREGDVFDSSLLVRARQFLYRTGLYSRVEMTTEERLPGVMDVHVAVDEAKAGTIDFGLGYGEYDRERGFVELRYRNLFGMNRQGGVRVEASALATRLMVNYTEPWFLGRRLPARLSLVQEQKKEINLDTGDIRYRVRKTTASATIEKQMSERVKAAFGYEASLVDTYDIQPDVEISKEDVGTLLISGVTPSLAYDTRDNPFDPQRGFFLGASVKTATGMLFSETDFVKTTAFASAYLLIHPRVVLAGSLRGGTSETFADTDELPLVERFFLGGRTTVRGYAQDMLGPLGEDGSPLGGSSYLVMNAEVRFLVTGSWRLVAFLDGGNVWSDAGDIGVDDLKYSAGGGLQYNTPVGPLRLDYGRKLDPEPDESKGEIHFSLGHAF
jgi:outer membrane protein insertion porin family